MGRVTNTACPCGSGQVHADCCGRFHAGAAQAPTAEALMRSRYSAFALGDSAYLLATWHPDTRPAVLDLDEALTWTGLEILATTQGGVFDNTGTVEFTARYSSRGRSGVQRELSRFVRDDGRWLYVEPA
ncbi:YchJ family protein [Spongisporangium articulatum]|uniref:UPF0225 protein ACIB24_08460 n=1 Tax=Spongisporangium articulatum TaxID=3362603 RepID=A0ABW8AL49_9ACTN